MELFLAELLAKYPQISIALVSIGTLLVFAQAVVLITPSKSDDEKLSKILLNPIVKKVWDFVISFAPIQKTKSGFTLSVDKKD